MRWMKLTAVPLAPGLEEGLVALDASRMVDLRASPTARDKQKQPGQCRRKTHSAIRTARETVDAFRGQAAQATRHGTHLRSQTTRLPPSKQMKHTTSSSSSFLLAGLGGAGTRAAPEPAPAPAPSLFFGGLPLLLGPRGAGASWRGGASGGGSPMIEPRNCESSIPAA